jgi:hypothetical protein
MFLGPLGFRKPPYIVNYSETSIYCHHSNLVVLGFISPSAGRKADVVKAFPHSAWSNLNLHSSPFSLYNCSKSPCSDVVLETLPSRNQTWQ